MSQTKKVIVFASSFLDDPVTESNRKGQAQRLLSDAAARHQVEIDYRCSRNPAEALTVAELEGAVAVIADLERYDEDLLRRVGAGSGGTLGLIARYGIGYNNVDLVAAKSSGVTLTNTPAASAPPTAEWAVATMLGVAGRIIQQYERAAAGKTKSGSSRLDLQGKTLGVIGTGTIGKRVIDLLTGFSMSVIAYDPYPNQQWAESSGVGYVTLEELCQRADFITLHASGGQRIIGQAEISAMKPTAVLVNCARGALVDNRAAYAAVKNARLYGYGLDEVWEYPDLDLAGLNIVVSPHVGSDTDEGKTTMQIMSAEAVVEFLGGKTPTHVVAS